MDFKGLFFSAEGRLDRLSFFLLAVLVGVVFTFVEIVFGLILPTTAASIVFVVLYVVNIYYWYFLNN